MLSAVRKYVQLPNAARAAMREDRAGLPREDPCIERAVRESIAWRERARRMLEQRIRALFTEATPGNVRN